jgi:phosphate transport system substrate-binding protein
MLLGACAPQPQDPTSAPEVRGQITFAGSTTVQPLADMLGMGFNELYPEVKLEIAAGGSTVGIKAIHDGTTDIGMASRSLKPEEEEGVEIHQIAVDVIAVVVHETNPVEGISMEELQRIYTGEIVNWEEVGGPDRPIVVVVRDENSGTRGAFDDIVLDGGAPSSPMLQKALTAGDVAATVTETPGAIGYVGFGNLDAGLRALAIDDVLPSEETAQAGSYRLVRPLLLLTGPLSQPLARRFVDYALSDAGQQRVVDNGWVPARRP